MTASNWKDVRARSDLDKERVAAHTERMLAEVRAHRLAEIRRRQHVSQQEVDADDEHTLPSKNGLELMARLMEAGVAQTQAITNQVLENYRLEALRARAELRAVREDVLAALNGDYVPSHHVLINRLYPNDARIGRARAAIEEEEEKR